jgi:predicted DNA-binding protein (MmcQ/YjbR family)
MAVSPDKTFEKVRKLCLSYAESSETKSWGHPNFRAGKKTFVTFERWEGRPSIAFRVEDAEKEKLRRDGEFFATPYGRGKWVSLWIDRPIPQWRRIQELVDASYRLVYRPAKSGLVSPRI